MNKMRELERRSREKEEEELTPTKMVEVANVDLGLMQHLLDRYGRPHSTTDKGFVFTGEDVNKERVGIVNVTCENGGVKFEVACPIGDFILTDDIDTAVIMLLLTNRSRKQLQQAGLVKETMLDDQGFADEWRVENCRTVDAFQQAHAMVRSSFSMPTMQQGDTRDQIREVTGSEN